MLVAEDVIVTGFVENLELCWIVCAFLSLHCVMGLASKARLARLGGWSACCSDIPGSRGDVANQGRDDSDRR